MDRYHGRDPVHLVRRVHTRARQNLLTVTYVLATFVVTVLAAVSDRPIYASGLKRPPEPAETEPVERA